MRDPADRLAWLDSRPEIDIFAGTISREPFIEQTLTTRASLQGAAPPRKRPRRVAKKLAKRGWRAHYDGGKALPAAIYDQHHGRAPALRDRLILCLPHEQTLIRVPDKMLGPQEHDRRRNVHDMPDWLRTSIPSPADPPVVPVPPERREQAAWGCGYRVRQYAAPVLRLLAPGADNDWPVAIRDVSEEWRAQDWVCERQVFERRFAFAVRIHAPTDKLDEHARIIGRQLERKAFEFCRVVAEAAHGYTERGRLVAKQTSYRPLTRVRLR